MGHKLGAELYRPPDSSSIHSAFRIQNRNFSSVNYEIAGFYTDFRKRQRISNAQL